MKSVHVSARSRGFSLVEVMVAVIVICVGLLGIAKMQALSLSNSTTSRQRSLAAIEAASLASAMHSNRQYWANTVPANFSATLNAGALASNEPALTAALAVTGPGACLALQCAPAALAAFDLNRWTNSLTALLPNPQATISCLAVAGVNAPTSCTIQVCWTEKAVAINQQGNAAANAPCPPPPAAPMSIQTPTYTLYVEP